MSSLDTQKRGYRLLRNTVSAAESDLAAATSTWAYFLANLHPATGNGKSLELSPLCDNVALCFDFKNANTDTCGISIYAYAEGGPAEFVFSTGNTILAGTQESDLGVSTTLGAPAATRYMGDTISTITQAFIGGSGAVAAVDEASNRVAKCVFATKGYKYILCLVTAVSTGDNARVWMREF